MKSFLRKSTNRSRPVSAAVYSGRYSRIQAPKDFSSRSDIIARMPNGRIPCSAPAAASACQSATWCSAST